MRSKDPLKHFKYPVDPSIVEDIRKWYYDSVQPCAPKPTKEGDEGCPTRIQCAIKSLEKKHYTVFHVSTREEALKTVMAMIPKGSRVGIGGSMTIQQLGVLQALNSGDYTFYNQYKMDLTPDEAYEIRGKGLTADYYVTGTNAITMNGELINLDGLGNRVAGITYGPKKVIIVVGINKFVADIEEGINRVKNYAAVLNCKRLNLKTPCLETGKCEDCTSPERICNHLLITQCQRKDGRVTIVIVGEELGF